MDEQKDPYYLTGKNRVMSKDYQGATEAFEKALEANPRSAAAHFELGVLYEKNSTNSARAIYHFEEYLRLRPNTDLADPVKQQILACKQELARTVSLGPVTQAVQRDLDRFMRENVSLRSQVEDLQSQLAKRPILPPPATPLPPTNVLPSSPGPAVTPLPARPTVTEARTGTTASPNITPAASAAKTHTVKSGETPASIARSYGISLNALLAANPTVNPRRMQVGQTLNIPSR